MSEMTGNQYLPPPVGKVPEGTQRPLWSVMIPTFNCASYLSQTLASVLAQDPGSELMQIEVVDDCSTKDDPEAVVRDLGGDRVIFHRKPENGGAIANFNTCIERSRGSLLHILHGDDWVQPGFYKTLEKQYELHPEMGLVASRSFYVDEAGIIMSVTERISELEKPSSDVSSFFYQTPIQTPGITARRSAYEKLGGFLPPLVHTADCEMWSRIIAACGGMILPQVLANYRCFSANDTGRLMRTGENVRDLMRLNELFASRHSSFSLKAGTKRAARLALSQRRRFETLGDEESALANARLWKQLSTSKQKVVEVLSGARRLVTDILHKND